MRRPRSMRLRVGAASALIAAVVLGALALLVTMQVGAAATASAMTLARADLQSYVVDLRAQPQEGPDLPGAEVLVLALDPDGTVERNTMPGVLATAARAVRSDAVVSTSAGQFAVVARTVRTPSGSWRLWAARDLTASNALLAGITTTLVVGTPIAALVVGIAAWFVATAVLRPVERLRVAAERLRRSSGSLPVDSGTELAELATTLNGLIVSLRESVDHERRLTADAAHELRTPLAVLAAQVEAAARRPGRAAIDEIGASVARLSRLTDSLLTLSRIETEGEASGSARVAELVTETMEEVDRARLLAPADVAVDLALGVALPEDAEVAIDRTSFARVLTNLVQNALAAGPASSVLVALAADGAELVITVEDDGPGVDPAFLRFAFDRFARSEPSRSSGSSGAGLGLALVRRLAERAGGTVRLANRPAGGAVATVRLPTR